MTEKKIRNLQRTYRKYLFNLSDLQNKDNIWWHSPFNHGKKVGFHLKLGGPLKNVKTRSGSSSGLGLSIYLKKLN
jgi:hypothetical protein